MLKQQTRCVIVAVVYVGNLEIKARYSVVISNKRMRSMVVSLVEYVFGADIV